MEVYKPTVTTPALLIALAFSILAVFGIISPDFAEVLVGVSMFVGFRVEKTHRPD